jgi:hypothetical protein
VEQTLAWFSRYRRLTVRYERRADTHLAFHHLAESVFRWILVENPPRERPSA